MIGAADESFHPPASEDPSWTETCWFSFWEPTRTLSATVYCFFRPILGVCAASVYAWDDRAELPFEVAYGRALWHVPIPEGDLTDLTLASGLSLRCEEPLRRHRIRYRDGDLIDLDVVLEAVCEPHALAAPTGWGHFDQPGRVSGRLTLRGEEFAIDCVAMRDRSWSLRPDVGGFRAGYSYAFLTDGGFHAIAVGDADESPVVAGFLLRDGETADLAVGRRSVLERRDGRPARVAVEGEDARGRRFRAEGECVNRLAFPASPGTLAWMSLVRWRVDGREIWGEDQDIWTPDLWRGFRRNGS